MSRRFRGSSFVALVTSVAFVLSGPIASAIPAAPAAPAASSKASTTTPTPIDGGWPRAYSTPSGDRLLLYQPQIASWQDQKQMVAYAAVAVEAHDAQKPEL